jgi:hypothetical protein
LAAVATRFQQTMPKQSQSQMLPGVHRSQHRVCLTLVINLHPRDDHRLRSRRYQHQRA